MSRISCDLTDLGLHPNWIALSTVDFERKVFLREGVEPPPPPPPKKPRILPSEPLDGESARSFYERIVSEEGAQRSNEPSEERKRTAERKRRRKGEVVEDVNVSSKEWFVAAERGDSEALGKMLLVRADLLDVRDEFGWSALMCAAQSGAANAVRLLVESGADVDFRDRSGRTAASLARANRLPSRLFRRTDPTSAPETSSEDPSVRPPDECDACRVRHDDRSHHSSTLHLFCSNEGKARKTHYAIPESNRGYQMLLRTGWDRERGLGRRAQGQMFPVKAHRKRDKNGIGFEGQKKSAFDAPLHPTSSVDNSKLDRRRLTRERIREINIRKELS